MDMWEYKVINAAFVLDEQASSMSHFLNRDDIGGDGWELVSTTILPSGCPMLIFKRRVAPTAIAFDVRGEQHKEEHEIYYHCGHSLTLTFTGTNEEIATYIRGHEASDCPACFAEKHPFATFVNVNIDDDSKEEDDED